VTSRAIPPFFVFFQESFLANYQESTFSGLTVKQITRHHIKQMAFQESFLANYQESTFSGLTVKQITRHHIKQMAGLVPLVCT